METGRGNNSFGSLRDVELHVSYYFLWNGMHLEELDPSFMSSNEVNMQIFWSIKCIFLFFSSIHSFFFFLNSNNGIEIKTFLKLICDFSPS